MQFRLLSTVPFNPSKIPFKSSLTQLQSLTSEAPGHLTCSFPIPNFIFYSFKREPSIKMYEEHFGNGAHWKCCHTVHFQTVL